MSYCNFHDDVTVSQTDHFHKDIIELARLKIEQSSPSFVHVPLQVEVEAFGDGEPKKPFDRKKKEEGVKEREDKDETEPLNPTKPALSSVRGGKMNHATLTATSANALRPGPDQPVATPSAEATSVCALRERLEKLRKGITKVGAVQEIVEILRDDLGVRPDVTVGTLTATGIGHTVYRLSMDREYPAVATAAMLILDRWKKMEREMINAEYREGPPLIITPMVSSDSYHEDKQIIFPLHFWLYSLLNVIFGSNFVYQPGSKHPTGNGE